MFEQGESRSVIGLEALVVIIGQAASETEFSNTRATLFSCYGFDHCRLVAPESDLLLCLMFRTLKRSWLARPGSQRCPVLCGAEESFLSS